MPAYYLEAAVVLLGLALLMLEAFTSGTNKRFIGHTALAGLLVVFAGLFFVNPSAGQGPILNFYTADKLALFYKGVALLCTALMIVLGLDYVPVLEKFTVQAGRGGAYGEFFCLPVFICAGLMWMASATDLTSIFVSLELVTVSFYVMTAFMRRNVGSLEAGVKYLILGALSTGFLVYGFTWLYGITGKTNLDAIKAVLAAGSTPVAPLFFTFALILTALAFKIGAAPLHFWIPDVYQGAPTPVTAYLSVGSKAAGFIVTTRLLETFFHSPLGGKFLTVVAVVAGATLLIGNFAAIPQTNFKRLLAYSSISHAGFLVLALIGERPVFDLSGGQITAFYLAGYLFMTMLAFAVLVIINRVTGRDDLSTFDGLHKRSPLLAFALVIAMASLAGVPLTVGFLGKFFVFAGAVANQHWTLLAIAIAGAAAGFYYYLKVLRNMFWNAAPEGADQEAISLSPLTRGVLGVLIAATVIFGVYPAPILNLLR